MGQRLRNHSRNRLLFKHKHQSEGPDFLCIGAQKAGTTWLYDQLKDHPEIWTPVIKELHYFNFVCPHPELEGREGFPMGPALTRFRFFRKRPSLETLLWLLRYNYGLRSDDDYRKLFPANGKLRGEFTPAYSTLDDEGVRRVHDAVPEHCRVFLIVRDPIDRAWSAIKMNHRWRNAQLDTEKSKLEELFMRPGTFLRSNYSRIVPRWRERFGERFGVFHYQDLADSPGDFLAQVLRFIGADPRWQPPDLHRRSNVDSQHRPLPAEVRQAVTPFFDEDIEFVKGLCDGPAGNGLAPMRKNG